MSATNNHSSNIHGIPPSNPYESKEEKGALFQTGMLGVVSSALLEVQKILSEVANLMGKQFMDQIESAKAAASDLAKSQRAEGSEQAKQMLIQGVTEVGGGVLTVGGLSALEAVNYSSDRYGVKKANQQLESIKGYKAEVNSRKLEANINEVNKVPVENEDGEIEMQELSGDNKEVVNDRSKALSKKENFVDGNDKAHIASEEKGEHGDGFSDKEIIKSMTDEQASSFMENLNFQEKALNKKLIGQAQEENELRNTVTTASQALSQVITGSGKAGAAVHATNASKEQASATEGQSALQSFQQVSGLSQGQFTKLIDEATALNDNLKSVANSNALVGG